MPRLRFDGKHIVLGVTGSIAAYKAVGVLRRLIQEGATVSVVMTQSATRFVTPLTFEVLSRQPVALDLFSKEGGMPHLTVPSKADAVLLAPCTANRLARYALGLADDLLGTMLLTTHSPVIVAPAMDGGMWNHPSVVDHVRVLRQRGVTVMIPETGELASAQTGQGRFPEEDMILSVLEERLASRQDWRGHRMLISAGPTREPIDAVRFITNGSTGRMGYALAQAAMERGADVVLVSGPTERQPPKGLEYISVVTAEEMYQALRAWFDWATVLIMTAAVGDFRPRQRVSGKIKKKDWHGKPLELERTTDILSALSASRTHQLLVGFAAESSHLQEHGLAKLKKKSLDMIVVNQAAGKESAFGSESSEALIMTRHGSIHALPRLSKPVLAEKILDELLNLQYHEGKGSCPEKNLVFQGDDSDSGKSTCPISHSPSA